VVYVAGADGLGRREVARGYLGGWTPDGRLLLTDKRGEEYLALNLSTGRRTAIIPRAAVARAAHVGRAGVGRPVWSADRRYVAALAGVAWHKRRGITATIVVARSDGRVIRLITSRYIISMIAWSPRGDRLAWTTSGFPNPHELFVLDEPTKKPRKLFGTSNRHFDWITWSPDGRLLLLDDANFGFHPDRPRRRPPGLWRLLDAQGEGMSRTFPRLGGRPLWCCPVNSYATLNG
jgi:dipeptidyl aminopeptidase/acylaminoacyl peptidase